MLEFRPPPILTTPIAPPPTTDNVIVADESASENVKALKQLLSEERARSMELRDRLDEATAEMHARRPDEGDDVIGGAMPLSVEMPEEKGMNAWEQARVFQRIEELVRG